MMPIRTTKDGAAKEVTVNVKDHELRISIGIGLLAFAVQLQEQWPEDFEITDVPDFAKSMRRQLLREEEDGTTPVHRMFDNAANQVLEQGDDGVDEGRAENGLKTAESFIEQIERRAEPAMPPEPAAHHWFSKAFIDVGAERRRQIEVENRQPDQDAKYRFGELAYAGACYAVAGLQGNPASAVLSPDVMAHALWPWELASFNPKDRRRNLERAAALLIAEMERLDAAFAEGVDPCPICAEPLKADDVCSTDITMGICHAACLEGSPHVDLETGEPMDGPIPTYRYGDVMGDKDPSE